MSRTTTSAVDAAIAADRREPGYLVEIGFPVPYRCSTRGDQNWAGIPFVGADLRLSGFGAAAAAAATSELSFGVGDGTIAALVLNYGVARKTVKVWQFYEGALASADPVLIHSGLADTVRMAGDGSRLSIMCPSDAGTKFTPRNYMTVETGYTNLTTPGTRIPWGNAVYVFEAEDG